MASRKDNRGYAFNRGECQRKSDGKYIFSFTTDKGKRKRIYANTLQELRMKEKEIRRQIDDGIKPGMADRITVNQIVEKYLSLKHNLKDSTRENYYYIYKRFIHDAIGFKRISRVVYSDVKEYYYCLLEEKGFNPNSMESVHTILHPAFQMAVRDGILLRNPTEGVMTEIKRENHTTRKKRHALTTQQQAKLSRFLENSNEYRGWWPIITVLLGTGMRIGECLGLRWEDVDFDRNMISVNHNLIYRKNMQGKCENHISTTKTMAGVREIPLLESVREAILEEYEIQRCIGFCEDEIDGYKGFLFSTCEHHVYTPESVNRAIQRIYANCNREEEIAAAREHREPVLIPHFSAHVLRHTFCTRLCENETNIKVIQTVMGHADIQTTMDIYAEVSGEKVTRSMTDISEKILV